MVQQYACKVLIVDDSPSNLYAIEVVLSALTNTTIIKATSIDELYTQLHHHQVALILLSNDMHECDGFTLTKQIKEVAGHQYVPILLISNKHLASSKMVAGYESGAIDFLCKPLEPQILLKKVQHFVSLNQLQQQNKRHKNEQSLILAAAGHGVIEVTANGQIIYANSKACELAHCDEEKLKQCSFNVWFKVSDQDEHDDFPLLSQLYEKANQNGSIKQRNVNLVGKNQQITPIEMTCTINKSHDEPLLVIVFQDISRQLAIEQKLVKMANYDPLTGLSNRSHFSHQLKRSVVWARRETATFALLMIDLDKFKEINDTYGHDVGDEVLITTAKRLRSITRENDTAARLGGDEFALIVENIRSPQAAEQVAEKIIFALCQPIKIHQLQLEISASIGIACSHGGLPNVTQLSKWADTALYAAKAQGRNQCQRYIPAMTQQAHLQASLHHYMLHLIENELFETYFQPIMDGQKQYIRGFEALARLPDFTNGTATILPEVFLPVAEQSYLTHKITAQVLLNAGNLLKQLQLNDQTKNVTVSVNVSSKQLSDNHFFEVLRKSIDTIAFKPECLVLELTEATILEQNPNIADTLQQIKSLGVKLALDDFGTGISGLNSLTEYPFDWIKIDPQYIHKINFCRKTKQLVKTTIDLAKNLDITCVAEAVENEQQLELLEHLGCDLVQGGYFSLAAPIEQLSMQFDYFNGIKIDLNKLK